MNALRQITDELVAALAPLLDGAHDPEALRALLSELGWTPNSVPQPVRDALTAGAGLLDALGPDSENIDASDALARVTRLVAAINAIANSPDGDFPGGL